MSLSENTISILKACHPVLEANREAIGRSFYQLLFTHHPETQNMFNVSHVTVDKDGNPGPQMLSLSDAVICYAGHCDQLHKLGMLVERVANKHVSFGVEKEHYPVVGAVLLQTLEDVLGKEVFNEEVKAAVAEGYFFLADIFISKEEEMKKTKEESDGGWRGWRKMVLKKKVKETAVHTSFYFVPEDDGTLMAFLPGQYISIRIPSFPYSMVRNYSLSSSTTSSMYRITVKMEKGGEVSSYLHNNTKEGDCFEIGVPCGDFVAENEEFPIVLIGAGIGITPLLSMLAQAAKRGLQALLIYRAHSEDTFPLKQEVEDIVRDAEDISMHVFYSVNDAGEDVSNDYSAETLQHLIPEKKSLFYLCGPESFTTNTAGYLKSLGVKLETISVGNFGPLVIENIEE